jgi:hypothetical protein
MSTRDWCLVPFERFTRVFSPDPNDEFIAKREKIVRNCRGRVLRKRNLLELVSMVDDTCRLFLDPTSKPSALTKSVELEIGKTVPSFRSSEHGLELGMCAAAGVVASVSHSGNVRPWGCWGVADVIAASLWSGLRALAKIKWSKGVADNLLV